MPSPVFAASCGGRLGVNQIHRPTVISFSPLPVTRLSGPTHHILGMALAPSTVRFRDQLWDRFQTFCIRNQWGVSETSLIEFIASLQISPSSAVTYLSALRNTLHPKDLLTRFNQGLLRLRAGQEIRHATPITQCEVVRLLRLLPITERMFLYVAWRTASRFDDVANLTPRSFLEVTVERIVIWWGNTTKTSQLQPDQPRFYVVLTPPTYQIEPQWWNEAVRFFRWFKAWNPATRERVHQAMKALNPLLTDHSVKTGAIDRLMTLATTHAIPLELISLVGKHKASGALSTTTLAYARNKVALALALGTQTATQWL